MLKRRRSTSGSRSRSRVIVLALVALVVIGGAGVALAAYDHQQDYASRLLPGTRIAGVEVGGLDRDAALAAVSDAIRPQLDRTVTVSWRSESWTTTPRGLGAVDDASDVIDAALEEGGDASFVDHVRMRVLGSDFDHEQEIAIAYPRAGVRGFVAGIASTLDREVRDATVDYSSGWVEVVPEREGRTVALRASRRALLQALRAGDSSTPLTVKTVEPEVTKDKFDQVLLVRIGENKLYLYEDGEITREWSVATGLPEYPTPTGIYEITEKRYLPTWVNPSPDTWGKDLPASIPPGPDNPLGLRALNWSAPAIRFHGTSAIYSLGYNASHGCVRMSNADVIELYDLIEVGTPIVSTVVAPLKPLYADAPDPTVVPDDEESQKSGDRVQRRSG